METYEKALKYLYSFIPLRRDLHTGEKGILRTKYLLKLLGDPQEKINVIHVAGTSGKGSTAYLTSILLKDQGLKVGLQVSPHLLDLRERFQINNELINKSLFLRYVNETHLMIDKAAHTELGTLTYFEINVCLAFYIFHKEKVDFAIMETGLGGLYDGTNVVENPGKFALLTRIGFDHQKVLGNTLYAISSQKAGIIKKGNTVITVQQKPTIINNFYRISKMQEASLHVVKNDVNFRNIAVSERGTLFDFRYKKLLLSRLRLGLIGEYQVENAAIALTALYELSKKFHFRLNISKIYPGLQKAVFKGRFEIFHTKFRDIIIDGAHNPQKMRAFISTLKILYPHQQCDFIISFSEGKNQKTTMADILKNIIPIADSIILTDFLLEGDDLLHQSVDENKIIPVLEEMGYKRYEFRHFNLELLQSLINNDKKPLVITGSLYLIGSIYKTLNKFFSNIDY